MMHELCEEITCQICCDHSETDHFICCNCEKELDPGSLIDAAEYSLDLER